jgi:two-component sensor histidine kinase
VDEDAADKASRGTHALRRGIRRLIEEKEKNKNLLSKNKILLSELNHRVKNNLQTICGLLMLQARTASPQVRERLSAAANRVQIMGRVHQRLYGGKDLHRHTLGTFFRELCADLSASSTLGHEIVCSIDGADVQIPVDQMISLALIVNELVSNITKHAYPEGAGGKAHVELECEGTDQLRLCVRDQGRGLPPEFDLERSGGVGTRIVAALVQQLGATLSIEPLSQGTKVTIVAPISSHASPSSSPP